MLEAFQGCKRLRRKGGDSLDLLITAGVLLLLVLILLPLW